ncbi:MAG: adenylate/guanylate cyclase domain-containing protein, partial [Gammaproteobacteria bacterium]|nr:adenylate/guanylate cyclase domain-containing protein [Gammaproteobacteria bacterium]
MARTQIVGYLLVLACTLAVQFFGLTASVDNRLLDIQFRYLRATHPRPVSPDVVIVGIDEATIAAFREPLGLWHPHLAQFFVALTRAQPAVVGLDVVLPDRSFDFLLPGHDRLLLGALLELKKAVPVVLAQTMDESGNVRPLFAPIVALVGPDALGLAVVRLDADGVQRRFETSVGTGPNFAPTLVTGISQRLGLHAKEGLIDYSLGDAFTFVPLTQVIRWLEAGDEESLVDLMRGKPVLLGSVLPFEDRHVVPVALAAWEPGNLRVPGVLVHAQALRSMLSGGPITPIPSAVSWLLCLAMTLLWWAGRRAVLGASLWVFIAAALAAGSTALLYHGTYIAVAGLIVIGIGSLLARLGVESWFAFRERRRLRNSFGPYVSPSVLIEILSGRLRPEMGGVRQKVCVLFSDIRGFTTRSEKEAPEQIVALLNRYFEEMAQAVHAHNGTLDKFIGDGLMAFFGVPGKSSNPARDALAAGQDMLRRLKDLNLRLAADGIPEVEIGIGLHLGEAVVGHVGSSQR